MCLALSRLAVSSGVEGEHGALWQEKAEALFPSGRLELLLQDFVLSPKALHGEAHPPLATSHPTHGRSPHSIIRQPTTKDWPVFHSFLYF